MAIPVLLTVELFPWNDLKGNAFEESRARLQRRGT